MSEENLFKSYSAFLQAMNEKEIKTKISLIKTAYNNIAYSVREKPELAEDGLNVIEKGIQVDGGIDHKDAVWAVGEIVKVNPDVKIAEKGVSIVKTVWQEDNNDGLSLTMARDVLVKIAKKHPELTESVISVIKSGGKSDEEKGILKALSRTRDKLFDNAQEKVRRTRNSTRESFEEKDKEALLFRKRVSENLKQNEKLTPEIKEGIAKTEKSGYKHISRTPKEEVKTPAWMRKRQREQGGMGD